ncbi:conserved hypothetical protein [gamma proteobacterium HdN1]|nr:conserved hypothetical protein [gamma proteobacterium HdN1]
MTSEARTLTTRKFSEVSVGEKLPNFNFPISVSFVVGSAIASRDFTPVHHDKAAANAAGLGNVFPNILADNGLAGRYVTDWAGPESTVKRINIKLGAPVLPGEDLKFTGEVAAKDDATGIVEIKVVAKGNWGMHLDGIVRVQLAK